MVAPTGRSLDMPVDGVSSPTRGPGESLVEFSADDGPLADLPEGEYILYVEASAKSVAVSWSDPVHMGSHRL